MILLLLVACGGSSTADSGDTASQYTVPSPSVYSWAPTIEQVLSTCEDSRYSVALYARGNTNSRGWLDIIESSAGVVRYERHCPRTSLYSSMNIWDLQQLEIETGSAYTADESTRFTCAELLADPPVLTFALRAHSPYIAEDHEPHCITWGHDPEGLRDGAYDDMVAFEAPEELRSCDIGLPPLMVSP